MDNTSLIDKIKSSYILENLFAYIKEEIYIKEKLFLYSKKFRKKLDIKLIILKEEYLKKIGFDLNIYLYSDMLKKDKKFLIKKYHNFLLKNKINKEKLENCIYDIFENKNIKDIDEEDIDKIENYEMLISIYSPFLKILSKTKNFGKIFTIHISDNYRIKDNYINCFNDLNKLNSKYESIYYELYDMNKLNYLKNN